MFMHILNVGTVVLQVRKFLLCSIFYKKRLIIYK